MKVLFLHTNEHDYLSESLFHGFRSLLGDNCVDVPRYDSMYNPLSSEMKYQLRGFGFTLYGLLEDSGELINSRLLWKQQLKGYDYIVIADINKQWFDFEQLVSIDLSEKLIILDGSDSSTIFPFTFLKNRLTKKPLSLLIRFSKSYYFKREFIPQRSLWKGAEKYIPAYIYDKIISTRRIFPVSFSIPESKIYKDFNRPRKNIFQKHIVDDDVAKNVKESFYSSIGSNAHIFNNEIDYYNDIRDAKFGVTTKRAGWDCLRHYELAGNGAVLCFLNLEGKPITCSPHGLTEDNSISYVNFADLMSKIHSLSENEFRRLQLNTYKWAIENSTVNKAKYVLNICESN